MKKFLDIFIWSLLIVLTINLFFGSDNETKKELSGNISIETLEKSYTIPAHVSVSIENGGTESIQVNPCTDISLLYLGQKIDTQKQDCNIIEIASGETSLVEYTDEYNVFSKAGQYSFEYTYGEKRYISSFEVEHRGSVSKLFSALFYAPVYNLLVFLITLFQHSLGWGILAITIIIRIILLWPQHKMMVSQKKLQTIQPKIKKIQEEHKGNQQMIGMKLMELYKKENVNPMGSCGFLLIQMPILLVIYHIILSIKDPANYFHIYSFQSDFNISSIDFQFFGIDLLQSGGITGIILALVVALIQFIQVKLSLAGKKAPTQNVVLEKKQGANDYSQFMPDPEMMNKFMLYGMPAMVAVFTFTLIAGVGLYWGMSTLFMVFQQLFVNKILKK